MNRTIAIFIAAVIVIGAGVGIFLVKRNVDGKYRDYEEQLMAKDEELMLLAAELEEYSGEGGVGPLVTVYRLIADKKAGTEFRRSDVETAEIPQSFISVSDEFITDLSILTGTIYKLDVKAGMPLCKSLFYKELLQQTDRYYDVVVDLFPVGAEKGSYFDLRIVTPNGLDYIVLAKKRAVEFYGDACRFILSQEEIYQYQSALIDTFVNKGTFLYMTMYIEPALQKKASVYYPLTDQITALMLIDPNIVHLAEIDLIMRQRAAFEGGLIIDGDTGMAIAGGRTSQIGIIQKAAADYNKMKSMEKQETGQVENTDPAQYDEYENNGNLMDGYEETEDETSGNAEDFKENVQDGITGGGW